MAESGQVWSAAGNRTSTEIISRYHIPVAGACAEPGQIRVVSWEGTTSDTLSTLRVTVAPPPPGPHHRPMGFMLSSHWGQADPPPSTHLATSLPV